MTRIVRIVRRPRTANPVHPWWTHIGAPCAVCAVCGAGLVRVAIDEDGRHLGLDCAGIARRERSRLSKAARAWKEFELGLKADRVPRRPRALARKVSNWRAVAANLEECDRADAEAFIARHFGS